MKPTTMNCNKGQRGVGFFVKASLKNYIQEFKSMNKRTAKIKLKCNEMKERDGRSAIICTHSKCNKEIEHFYNFTTNDNNNKANNNT